MRRAAAVALVLVAGGAALAVSGPSSRVAWTADTVARARSGDPARGKALNKDCADCHGAAGSVDTPDVPNLAGQDPLYTYKQLQDYKAKRRESPIMNEAVASLSDRDMADLAAFYAGSRVLAGRARTAVSGASAAERLASVGDGERLIPACDACHGGGGAGNPRFYGMPALAIQKAEDLATELTTFKTGERGNDVYRVMRDVCGRLTDAEIAALAKYYAVRSPAAPTRASAVSASPRR